MVCSIYTEPQKRDKFVRIKVFFVNAILDSVMVSCLALPKTNAYQCQICKHIFIFLFNLISLSFVIQALDKALISEGYTCVEKNIPLLCYGNQRDFEVSLMMDSEQGLTHISTQVHNRVLSFLYPQYIVYTHMPPPPCL